MWAMIYPGQGSQHPGMGRFLYDNFASCKQLFEEASDAIKVDFRKLCFDSDEKTLALTENTQPALLLTSVASYRAVTEIASVNPIASSGHSVGEYAAVVNAGAMGFSDAVVAVRKRGQFMQSAVPVGQGGMLAVIGLENQQVLELCRWAEETSEVKPLEPANFNAPGQVVVSGSLKLIQWVQENFNKDMFTPAPRKARLIPLNVSAPFHCSMMKPAEEQMAGVLSETKFQAPAYPIVQNVTAVAERSPDQLRTNLIKQVSSPVRWVDCVDGLHKLGATRFLECGPGKVLSGLVKKIDSENLSTFNMNSLEDIKALEAELNA